MNHLKSAKFEYFFSMLSPGIIDAYFAECFLWHSKDNGNFLNKIHPASPSGTDMLCPYCITAEHFVRLINFREVG